MNKHLKFDLPFIGILFLLLVILGCKGDKIEDISLIPDVSSKSRSNKCKLIITGRIVDTKNLKPIEGAIVSSSFFTTTTNKDGSFKAILELAENDHSDIVTITHEGYLKNTFPVFYNTIYDTDNCPNVTNIDWKIGLSARKTCVWVGKNEGVWYKIMDTVATTSIDKFGQVDTLLKTKVYAVDIRRGALKDYANLCVSPNNSFSRGPGILGHCLFPSEIFAIENMGGTDIEFIKPLEIVYAEETVTCNQESNMPVLDLDKLTTNIIGKTSSLPNTQTMIKVNTNGNIYIGLDRLAHELCFQTLNAIRNEESITVINNLLIEYYPTAIKIDMDEIINDKVVKEEVFSNCDCGKPINKEYNVGIVGTESLQINFPSTTSNAKKAKITAILKGLLSGSGASNLDATLQVNLDQCSMVTVTSTELVRRVTGTFCGISFEYKGTDRLETIMKSADRCPVETGCHQGCTG